MPPSPWPLKDKTLVAWVSPDSLTQRGGSVLTIEKPGGIFDAIVFGEVAPATWMAGSDSFRRTQQAQREFPSQTTVKPPLFHIAIVYKDRQISLFRNGQQAATYTTDGADRFPNDSLVLMGLRHQDAGLEHRFFTGSIDDARVYAIALAANQIAALKPNQPSEPKPLAWWDFENGSPSDRMKTFPTINLFG